MRRPTLHNRYKGTAPYGAKYIGRGTPWGNPIRIVPPPAKVIVTREEAVERFKAEVLPTLDVEPLRGHDLVCYCVPKICHGMSIMDKLYGPGNWDIANERPNTKYLKKRVNRSQKKGKQ